LGASPSALAAVKASSGRATVPQIFIGGSLIGGADEAVAALESGILAGKIDAAGATPPLPAPILAALGAAAAAGEGQTAPLDAGPPPPMACVAPAEMAALEAVATAMGGGGGGGGSSPGEAPPVSPGAGGGEPFSLATAAAWLDAHAPATRLDRLVAARLVSFPCGGVPGGWDVRAAVPHSLNPLPPSTPLLLVRASPPSPPGTPLNARFAWVGPSRPAALVAAGLRARILALYDRHLSGGGKGVDYGALAADPAFSDYARAAAELQAASDAAALPPRPDRAALFINLYNALIIHATAERGAPADSSLARARFFAAPGYLVGVGGDGGGSPLSSSAAALSADDIEHGILRGNSPSPASLGGILRWPGATHFKGGDPRAGLALPGPPDPRLHAALVCGAKSCPPVRVYGATGLDAALDAAVAAWCEGDDTVGVDEAGATVTLSSIFKWYGRDWVSAGVGPVLGWLPPFLGEEKAAALQRVVDAAGGVGRVRIQYAPYDWGVNSAGKK
jgi:hypothetical protein